MLFHIRIQFYHIKFIIRHTVGLNWKLLSVFLADYHHCQTIMCICLLHCATPLLILQSNVVYKNTQPPKKTSHKKRFNQTSRALERFGSSSKERMINVKVRRSSHLYPPFYRFLITNKPAIFCCCLQIILPGRKLTLNVATRC